MGRTWDTGGAGRCRKHEFHAGIVFHREKTLVTPLVMLPRNYKFYAG